jgi:hypothetical protein
MTTEGEEPRFVVRLVRKREGEKVLRFEPNWRIVKSEIRRLYKAGNPMVSALVDYPTIDDGLIADNRAT